MIELIDLTMPIREGMRTYPSPNHPRVEISKMATLDKEGRATRRVVLGTHTGTHVDAASHFIEGGGSVDRLELDVLAGPAYMIDLSAMPPGGEIRKGHLAELERLPKVSRLILRTDWSRMLRDDSYYIDHPYLSMGACEHIVSRGIRFLGMDIPTPEKPGEHCTPESDSPNHKYLLGNGVTLVEGLTNLDKIPSSLFNIIALPLPIVEGDGAPARVIALCGNSLW